MRKILVCFIILYISGLLIAQQFNISRLNREIDAVSEQIELAEREGEILQSEKEASQTDEYVERVAREKLGYMKPYEKVFIDSSK